eukprot:84050-Prorocentrum_minimum.AAC.1
MGSLAILFTRVRNMPMPSSVVILGMENVTCIICSGAQRSGTVRFSAARHSAVQCGTVRYRTSRGRQPALPA